MQCKSVPIKVKDIGSRRLVITLLKGMKAPVDYCQGPLHRFLKGLCSHMGLFLST